ncbi:hypothetical protein [Streptomyces sp. NPDC006134]|uniref:hypothetical protein n=1 Tax=Streptomyces sp. NPDC006134 TaxID=3154467 RepID=UPI0033E4B2D4
MALKTDPGAGHPLRKAGAEEDGTGPVAAKRGAGSRVGSGLLGVLFLLFGLVLVGSGYEEGPKKVADGTFGTVVIEQCGTDAGRDDDVECTGTFRSDGGGIRYDVEDFEAGSDRDRGEKVEAVAFGPMSSEHATPASLYVEGARFWCVAASMAGVAVFPLSAAFAPSGRRMRRGTLVTGLVLLFGGLLGCGVCVLANSVLL